MSPASCCLTVYRCALQEPNGSSLLASDPESSPDRPAASHPPPGLLAPPLPPRADVVTSSAATKDLQAAFGFDDSDSEDSPAKLAPAATKPEPVTATVAQPPSEPAELAPAAVDHAARDAESPAPVQRRFHWMQLEPSPTRPGTADVTCSSHFLHPHNQIKFGLSRMLKGRHAQACLVMAARDAAKAL